MRLVQLPRRGVNCSIVPGGIISSPGLPKLRMKMDNTGVL